VVIAIISLLVSILIPSLAKAKDLARETTCLTRISGQIKAVHLYASENNSAIPVGPERSIGPWMPVNYCDLASNQIIITGSPAVEYTAHGALLGEGYLSADMFFCPDDDSSDAQKELEEAKTLNVNSGTYCSYFYRQLDEVSTHQANLDNLGLNSKDVFVRALIMDANSRMVIPNTPIRFNHRGERINIAFIDASANTFEQPNEEYFLRHGDEGNIEGRMNEILQTADELRK